MQGILVNIDRVQDRIIQSFLIEILARNSIQIMNVLYTVVSHERSQFNYEDKRFDHIFHCNHLYHMGGQAFCPPSWFNVIFLYSENHNFG